MVGFRFMYELIDDVFVFIDYLDVKLLVVCDGVIEFGDVNFFYGDGIVFFGVSF